MPIIEPVEPVKLKCEACQAQSTASEGDGVEEYFPDEEGWIIFRVSEVVPNPDREVEAQVRARLEEQSGEEIDAPWETPELAANIALGCACPKHAAAIRRMLGMNGKLPEEG